MGEVSPFAAALDSFLLFVFIVESGWAIGVILNARKRRRGHLRRYSQLVCYVNGVRLHEVEEIDYGIRKNTRC